MNKTPSGESEQPDSDFILAEKSLTEVLRLWFGFGVKMFIFIVGLIVLIFAIFHWG